MHNNLDGLLDSPTPAEFGGSVTAYTVDDESMASFGMGTDLALVVSALDIPASPIIARLADTYNSAATGASRVYTHLQQRTVRRSTPLGGSNALGEWDMLADVHEDDSAVHGDSHLPFIGDDVDGSVVTPLTSRRVSFSVPDGSRLSAGDAGTQSLSDAILSRDAVAALVRPRLGAIGLRYADLFIEALHEHQGVLRPMRGGSSSHQVKPRVLPGTPVCRDGLRRPPRHDILPKVWDECDRLVSKSIVEEISDRLCDEQWLLPPVVAVRQNGAIRFCLDAKKPNLSNACTSATVLPDSQCHIEAVANAHLLSCIDKPDAFHQLPVDEVGRLLFGFALPDVSTGKWRYFRYKCAIFGFSNFPGWFQDFIQDVLCDIPSVDSLTRVPIFLDNVDVATLAAGGLSPSSTAPVDSDLERDMVVRHVRVLSSIFAAYAAAGLTIKLEKCTFGAPEVSTMGVVAGSGHYRTDPAKLEGYRILCALPDRVSIKWLRAVLGTLNYMRRMLGTQYTSLADPLFSLLRDALAEGRRVGSSKAAVRRTGDSFLHNQWGDVHTDALESLVALLRKNVTIAVFRHGEPVHLRMDSSDAGTGGAAGQYGADNQMYYCIVDGHRFTPLQRLWSVGARETFGWLLFMRRWWRRLVGYEVVFGGDHLNLLHAEDLENTTVRRWLLELSSFSPWMAQFRVKGWTARFHVPGVCIALCDFLSRHAPPDSWLPPSLMGHPNTALIRRTAPAVDDESASRDTNAHTSTLPPFVQRVLDEQRKQSSAARERYITAHKAVERVTSLGAVLFVGSRLAVPETATDLITFVLTQTHDRFGHPDVERTLQLIADARIFIPRARQLVTDWYNACSCQLARAPSSPQLSGPYLLAPTAAPLDHVYADFASLLDVENVDGTIAKGLLLQVDKTSRMVLLTIVPAYSAETAIAGYRRWRSLFGTPSKYSTDGGRHFANSAFTRCLVDDGVAPDVGTPYHPRGRGAVERQVGRAKQLLRRVLPPGQPQLWPAWIDEIQFLLNSLPNRALAGRSAFEYLYGVAPRRRLTVDVLDNPSTSQAHEDRLLLISSLRWLCDACSDTLAYLRAAESAKQFAEVHFDIGDTIALFYPDREHALAEGYYRGPYRVTDTDKDFYVVREVLANKVLGKPVRTHVSRMLPYNASRVSDVQLHQAKLPDGYFVIKSVVAGPRPDGRFQVAWHHTPDLTWEPPSALWACAPYKEYCTAHGLDLSGVPTRAAPPADAGAPASTPTHHSSGRPRRAVRRP
jgi:hypothetical protein